MREDEIACILLGNKDVVVAKGAGLCGLSSTEFVRCAMDRRVKWRQGFLGDKATLDRWKGGRKNSVVLRTRLSKRCVNTELDSKARSVIHEIYCQSILHDYFSNSSASQPDHRKLGHISYFNAVLPLSTKHSHLSL